MGATARLAGIGIALLAAAIVVSSAEAAPRMIVLFPVSEDGTDSQDFGWQSAMSQLAESLQEELGPGYALVPQCRVESLCKEFWRNHTTWTWPEARRQCENRLHADLSVGVQVTHYAYDVNDQNERRTACRGECEQLVGHPVDAFGRVWAQLVTYFKCQYEESPYVLHRVTAEAQLEVQLYAYDVNRVTTLVSRSKRLQSHRTSSHADSEGDPSSLRECPHGPLQDSPVVTPRLAGVPFHRRAEMPDAHELLRGQWEQFARAASSAIKEALIHP